MNIQRRLDRIYTLIAWLDNDKPVLLRDVENAFPDIIRAKFDQETAAAKNARAKKRHHPRQLAEYNKMLRTADLLTVASERASSSEPLVASRTYQKALDSLMAWQASDADIEHWFDRPLDWQSITPTRDGVPRCAFFQSDRDVAPTSKMIKRAALVAAKLHIERYHADDLVKPFSDEQARDLKVKLAKLRSRTK